MRNQSPDVFALAQETHTEMIQLGLGCRGVELESKYLSADVKKGTENLGPWSRRWCIGLEAGRWAQQPADELLPVPV